jgi:hypothetical protein
VAGDEGRGRVLQLLRALEPDQLDERNPASTSPSLTWLVDALQGDELRLATGQGAEIRQQGGAYAAGCRRKLPENEGGAWETSWL